MLPLAQLYEDFAKRDFHLWVYKNHNAHALAEQFPKYTLSILHRIRRGIRPMYMPERTYLTLKGIMEFAKHHQLEAGKLKFGNLASKYGVSEDTISRHYKEWSKTR